MNLRLRNMPESRATRKSCPGWTLNDAGRKSHSRTSFENESGAKGTVGAISPKPVCRYQSGSMALHLLMFEVVRELMRGAKQFSRSANGVKI